LDLNKKHKKKTKQKNHKTKHKSYCKTKENKTKIDNCATKWGRDKRKGQCIKYPNPAVLSPLLQLSIWFCVQNKIQKQKQISIVSV